MREFNKFYRLLNKLNLKRKKRLHLDLKGDIMLMQFGDREIFYLQGVKGMEILNISISGFRNISKVNLNFDKVTALVGLNGYGKSNVIDAIDFGFDFIHANRGIREALMSSKKNIPILKSIAGKKFDFEIELRLISNQKSYDVKYDFSFSWHTEKETAKIENEILKIKKNLENQKYNLFISRNGNNAKIKTSESGRCSKNIKIESNDLVINKLLSFDDLYYADIINQINSVQYYVERHLDASQSFVPSPFVFKGFKELELHGMQSIPRAIFFLKKDFPRKYELLIDAFKQLFPNIKDINVREIKLNGKIEGLHVEDDAPIMYTDCIYSIVILDDRLLQPINFESLSDGTKRIFLMLTIAVVADIKNLPIISIEEPENSIHPGLFQSYLDILNQLINNCKIIITSHSPYIIQYINPKSIYIGMPNKSGEVDFRRISPQKSKTLLKDAAEYDKTTGDYIFNILSSSDAEEFLKGYVEKNE